MRRDDLGGRRAPGTALDAARGAERASRRLSARLLAALLLLVPISAASGGASGAHATWFDGVAGNLARDEYDITPHRGGEGYTAPNRAQGLRTTWYDGTVVVTPRVAGSAWSFRYELANITRDGANLARIDVTCADVTDNRIEWRRGDDVREWYVNDRRGIEQIFALERRPAGTRDAPIAIDGRIEGLLAYPSANGQAVLLKTPAGVDAMRIHQLVVRDAGGMLLPAWFGVSPGLLSIMIDDRHAAYPVTVDPLMSSPAWTAEGDQSLAQFGGSVATAGDVNGDGFADVIVSAPLYDNGEADEGRVFVYIGSPSGLSGMPASMIEIDRIGAEFGKSVATAGDVNGDGFSDVIVGAPGFSNGELGEGAAFLYLGSAAGLSPTATWTIEGGQMGAALGSAVSTAGDVNGDGFADALVGAPGFTNGEASEGRALVFLGMASGLAAIPAWSAEGDQPGARFGAAVATAADVNGDGYSDVILGAPLFDNGEVDEGRAFVYFGMASGLSAAAAWTAEGDQSGAQFGSSVATAGDVNGDGYSDVIVGAPMFDDGEVDEGSASVYFGSAVGLSASPTWSVHGDQVDARLGTSASTAGDVNGDGFADVVVGAPRFDGSVLDGGRALAYQGSASGLSVIPTWTADGEQVGAQFGFATAVAGDVNGDGYSDVIVGAVGFDGVAVDGGAARAYHGSPAGPSSRAAWSVEGNQNLGNLGYSVTTAGDVDGDGYSDVIVGEWLFDNGEFNAGRVLVYHGSAAGLSATAAWTVEGDRASAQLGSSAATAGDVNGDGYSDVIVGSQGFVNGERWEGRALVYHGSASGLMATPAWSFEGDRVDAQFGHSVATAGDVNGDGFSDVIIGTSELDSPGVGEGGALLFLGSSSGLAPTPAWTVEGEPDVGAYLGDHVASAGDVNGDGYSDVVLGASGWLGGRAFVYLGSASGLAAAPAWTAEGNSDQFGESVATAGDVNGDGYSDVIIGAFLYTGDAGNEGAAFVFLGSAAGLSPTPAWRVEGDQPDARLGRSVATAGDVNGDGYSDVVVGASLYDGLFTPNEGRALVYLGSPLGLATTPAWIAGTGESDTFFGGRVETAGDVNGDGYSDVLVASAGSDTTLTGEGAAFLYYGNDGDGLDRIPRQRRSDDSAPIDILGLGDATNGFRVHARARSPFGRDRVRLEAEIEPLGTPFDGVGILTTPYTDTGAPGPDGSFVDLDVPQAPLAPGPHHWRVRMRGTFPFPWQSHWMSPPSNCATETDLRVALPCEEPSALDLRPLATPLLVMKSAAPDTVTLTWENTGAAGYHVYGGDIADLAPARPQPVQVICAVATNATGALSPGPGRWFLVVSSCGAATSSYGRDSSGRERDPAALPCP